MSWYKVSLTQKQVEENELVKLQDKFVQLFTAADEPREMVLFGEKELSNDDQLIYFSPVCLDKATSLISSYSGTPCKKPERGALTRLVGGYADFDLL